MKKIPLGGFCVSLHLITPSVQLNPAAFRRLKQVQLLTVQILLVLSPTAFVLGVVPVCSLVRWRCYRSIHHLSPDSCGSLLCTAFAG